MRKKLRLSLCLFFCVILGSGVCIFIRCKTEHPVLRVATNIWPGYEIFYLARSLGYYNDFPVRLVEVPSTSMITRSLRNGTLEAGCLTLDEAIMLLQDDIDIRVILILDESCGGDVLMAKPGINSLQDLRGKRIGFENSTVTAILLDAALTEANIPISEIKQVYLPIDEHFNGFMEGKVDAIATFEPVRSRLLEQNAKIIYSSAQIPGRIIEVLVVRTEVLDAFHDELTALLNGYFRALDYFNQHPAETSGYMEKRLGRDPMNQFNGLHIPSLHENYFYLKGDSAQINKSSEKLMEFMLKRKLLRHQFSFTNLAEPKFLPIAQP